MMKIILSSLSLLQLIVAQTSGVPNPQASPHNPTPTSHWAEGTTTPETATTNTYLAQETSQGDFNDGGFDAISAAQTSGVPNAQTSFHNPTPTSHWAREGTATPETATTNTYLAHETTYIEEYVDEAIRVWTSL
jgi:hypothetical protein